MFYKGVGVGAGALIMAETAPVVIPYVLTAAGTPQAQRALEITDAAAWDILGTGQPGVWEFLKRTKRFIEGIFSRNECKQ